MKGIFVYLFAIIVALLIYQFLNYNIEIALKPIVWTIHVLYQYQFEYIPYLGYKEVQGLFIIGKDCLGARLFVYLFSIFIICHSNNRVSAFRWFFHLKTPNKILYFCIISLLLSYTITIIRITASIPFCKMNSFNLIHTILSLIIYFGSGLTLYAFLVTVKKE